MFIAKPTNEATLDLSIIKFDLNKVNFDEIKTKNIIFDYSEESFFRFIESRNCARNFFDSMPMEELTIISSDWSEDFARNCLESLCLKRKKKIKIQLKPLHHLDKILMHTEKREAYHLFSKQRALKPFVFLNRSINVNRVKIMLEILKSGESHLFYKSWLNRYNVENVIDQIMVLDSLTADKTQHFYPSEYQLSAIDLYAESNGVLLDYNPAFITEKTWRPLLCQMPFLGLLGSGSYQKLKEYGFQLYDELINYDFDSETDVDLRVKKFISNIDSICRLWKSNDLDQVMLKIQSKLIFNQKRALELFQSHRFDLDFEIEV